MRDLYRPPRARLSTTARYAVPTVTVIAASVLTRVMPGFLEPMRFFFFWVAIVLSALYGGWGPALLASALSTLASMFLVFGPVGSMAVASRADVVRIALFISVGGILSWAVGLRQNSDERAQDLREWLVALLSSIADCVIATDFQGNIVFINPAAERLTGWSADEASGKPVAEVLRTVRTGDLAGVLQTFGEPSTSALETELITRSDQRVPIEMTLTRIGTREGRPVGRAITFRDISMRRKSERILRDREERFRAFVTATAQIIWIADAGGQMVDASFWTELTGQPMEDAKGHGSQLIVHPDDQRHVAAKWEEAVRTGAVFYDEYRMKVPDGSYRWFSARGVPVKEQDGSVREWIGTTIDIDDRRRTEDDLRFINEASVVLSSSLDYEVTLKQVARMAVPRFADWCAVDIANESGGYSRLSVAHVDPEKIALAYELAEKYPPQREEDAVAQVIRTGETQLFSDIPDELLAASIRDPEQLSIIRGLGLRSVLLVPMSAAGRTFGALTFVSAESRRRYTARDLPLVENLARRAAIAIDNARLFRDAELANRAKDDFLATLSHELRTPLTSILGWSRMLQIGGQDPATLHVALETIERSARAQAQLVDDIFDISRIVSGKFELDMADADLVSIVEEVLASFHPAAEAKRMQVELRAPKERAPLKGDAGRLKQIVWNLLSNAIKFTPEGGKVVVSVERGEDRVRLKIRDTGRGIDPEFLPHVWERFRQADSSTTRQYGGLGLGLSLVRYLVELHGGAVEAQSGGVGKGATFIVDLPVTPAEISLPDAPVEPIPLLLDGTHVLVVDDEPDTRHILSAMLQRFGARVRTAGSVEEGLEALNHDSTDIVISDLAMPGQDGYALIRRLRQRPSPHLPVIAVSALGSMDDRNDVLAAGFDDYLRKPVDPEQLVSAVARVVARR
jgi:PAS domain S-box-containing protein